jgi:hypothetical protein
MRWCGQRLLCYDVARPTRSFARPRKSLPRKCMLGLKPQRLEEVEKYITVAIR